MTKKRDRRKAADAVRTAGGGSNASCKKKKLERSEEKTPDELIRTLEKEGSHSGKLSTEKNNGRPRSHRRALRKKNQTRGWRRKRTRKGHLSSKKKPHRLGDSVAERQGLTSKESHIYPV